MDTYGDGWIEAIEFVQDLLDELDGLGYDKGTLDAIREQLTNN